MKFRKTMMLFTLITFSMLTASPLQVTAQETSSENSSTTSYKFTLTLDAKIETTKSPALPTPKQAKANDQTFATYYIGDLIVPINEERKVSLFETGEFDISDQLRAATTAKDFSPIIELIQSTIDSESWMDSQDGSGTGSITPYLQNLSLVVGQTEPVQHKVQDLLRKLRELNDVMIKFDSQLVIVDKSSVLVGESFSATSTEDYRNKVRSAANKAFDSSKPSSAVAFNGEQITSPLKGLADDKLDQLYLQAVVTSDLKAVRLSCTNKRSLASVPNTAPPMTMGLALNTKPAKADEEAEQRATAVSSQVFEIAHEGFVTIDVTPMLKSNDNNRTAILFVRPTISHRGKQQLN